MFKALLVLGLALNCQLTAAENKEKHSKTENKVVHALPTTVSRNNVASHHNISYIDKAENMLLTPNVKKIYEQHNKMKKPKKSPKSTIQKIIKKNKAKQRKMYMSQRAKKTTSLPKIDYDKFYGQDDKQWRDEATTTQANQRKRSRKYSPKAGYHMPFQKLHAMKEKRSKRGLSRELRILKDLDEIEVLSREDGNALVKTHLQNFW